MKLRLVLVLVGLLLLSACHGATPREAAKPAAPVVVSPREAPPEDELSRRVREVSSILSGLDAGKPEVRAWIDESRESNFKDDFHFAFPIDDRWAHVVAVPPPTSTPAQLAALRIRFADHRLWAQSPGIEILEAHADGTADARVLGYLRVTQHGPDSLTADFLAIASRHTPTVSLKLSNDARPDVENLARTLAKSHEPFGPPGKLGPVERTSYFAVGTCNRDWLNALPVVLRGRLSPLDSGEYQLDAEHVERTLPVATWTALRPRYTKAIKEVTLAVKKKDLPAASAATRRLEAEVQRAYGEAAPLLELDALLRRLDAAFARGSASSALIALEDTRCDWSTEEQALEEALKASVP